MISNEDGTTYLVSTGGRTCARGWWRYFRVRNARRGSLGGDTGMRPLSINARVMGDAENRPGLNLPPRGAPLR